MSGYDRVGNEIAWVVEAKIKRAVEMAARRGAVGDWVGQAQWLAEVKKWESIK